MAMISTSCATTSPRCARRIRSASSSRDSLRIGSPCRFTANGIVANRDALGARGRDCCSACVCADLEAVCPRCCVLVCFAALMRLRAVLRAFVAIACAPSDDIGSGVCLGCDSTASQLILNARSAHLTDGVEDDGLLLGVGGVSTMRPYWSNNSEMIAASSMLS